MCLNHWFQVCPSLNNGWLFPRVELLHIFPVSEQEFEGKSRIVGGDVTGLYDDHLLAEINGRLDIVDIVAETVSLTRKGNRYWGVCPFHDEKTPSFSVTPVKNMFYCFGCHAGGNLFTYVMKRDGLDFKETVQMLAARAGIQLLKPNARKQDDRLKRVLEVNRAAAEYYHRLLTQDADAGRVMQYLRERHLDGEIVERFQLGYAGDQWSGLHQHLTQKGYDQEVIKESGLIRRSKNQDGYYDLFRDRIIFPIYNYQGSIVGFGGRTLQDATPKYLNTPETQVYVKRNHLYGLYQARETLRKTNEAILVEGYMDCLKLQQHGIYQAVASLGTALTREQAMLLRRYAEHIIILYDGDDAGQRETMRAIDVLREQELHIDVVTLPDGKDPDDFVDMYGKEEFLHYIQNNRMSYLEFKIKRYINEEKSINLQSQIRIISRVKDDINSISSEIQRDHFIKMLSRRLKIEENLIAKELWRGNNQKNENAKNKTQPNRNNIHYGNYSLEEKILAAMLQNRDIMEHIAAQSGIGCFEKEELNRLAEICYEMEGTIESRLREWQQSVAAEGLDALLARIATILDENTVPDKVQIHDYIHSRRQRLMQDKWSDFHHRLEQMSGNSDFNTVLDFILDLDTFLHQTREGGIL